MHPDGSRAAIVLAAGMSRRMGRLKMLLPFGDRPMLACILESILDSPNVSSVTVVTGHAEQEMRRVAGEYERVQCAHNPHYAEGGMLSSVKVGVGALPTDCSAFFLLLGDQPMVRPATLAAISAAWHPEKAPIVVPSYRGKRGHPVLFARRFGSDILALGEQDTLKTLMHCHKDSVHELAVNDESTVLDIDTPEDYEAALLRWRRAEP